MIFLDTDILSYFLSGNKDIYAKIQEAINGGKRICITWINVYEIFKGLRFNNSYKKEEMFKNFLNVIDIYGLNFLGNQTFLFFISYFAPIKSR